jgi:CubicO group peptidase (beta-lactamase class C family)
MSLSRLAMFLGALLCAASVVLAYPQEARAQDDNENSTPTAWWNYHGQSMDAIKSTIKSENARITDIVPDDSSYDTFTVTYVQNTGTYAKQWWWYIGIDENTLKGYIATNHARLVSLKAYDIGGGDTRFAVAMVANSGADAKQCWWYFGKTQAELAALIDANKARLTELQTYPTQGQTVFSAIMIANQGADGRAWWWYPNDPAGNIDGQLSQNSARIIDITPAGGGFNVVMEGCSSACPGDWWYYGVDPNGTLAWAQDNGARIVAANPYSDPGCAANFCYAAWMISDTPADVTACGPQGCISEAKLAANICGAMAGKVVGYACIVGQVRPVYGGLARTATDSPSLQMAPHIVTNIASVSKTMTAVAVIQLLAKDHVSIKAAIAPYLYPDWKRGPNIDSLTFFDLLTHQSGFAQVTQFGSFGKTPCEQAIDYDGLEAMVAHGVSASNIGAGDYGNCNFALLRELMPKLQGHDLSGYANGPGRAQESSAEYIDYLNAHVFQPVGVPQRQCRPSNPTNVVLSYPFPPGSTPGNSWGDWTLSCGGGGWVLSANDIFAVVNSLAGDSRLLNNTLKQPMFTTSLGWDSAVRSDCPSPNVCKNGGLVGSGTTLWLNTYAGILACNVPVVAVANSPLSEDIIDIVADAYAKAKVPGAPRPCPKPPW